jgi:hypothetical protein
MGAEGYSARDRRKTQCRGAGTAVESEGVKKRFHDLSSVPPETNEHAPEVLQQLVTRDVEKYRKLLQNDKP